MYYIKINFIYKSSIGRGCYRYMGAGDSYFAAFLSDMLKNSPQHKILDGSDEQMYVKIQNAMKKASEICRKDVRKRRCILDMEYQLQEEQKFREV